MLLVCDKQDDNNDTDNEKEHAFFLSKTKLQSTVRSYQVKHQSFNCLRKIGYTSMFFLPFFQRETTSVSSCLLPWTKKPF